MATFQVTVDDAVINELAGHVMESEEFLGNLKMTESEVEELLAERFRDAIISEVRKLQDRQESGELCNIFEDMARDKYLRGAIQVAKF